MATYTFNIIEFDDLSPGFPTGNSTGNGLVGDTFTVDANATPITIVVDDDDPDFDDGFIDFPNNSTAGNNQLIADPVTINGTDYGPPSTGGTPEDQIELEFSFQTTTGLTYYVVRINGENVGLATADALPAPGSSFRIRRVQDGQSDSYSNLLCFGRGTLIQTPEGQRPVETLKAGDLVNTMDAGAVPVVQVLLRTLSVPEQIAMAHLRPILFEPGAIGNTRRLYLSPQHRVVVSDWRSEFYLGAPEVLVPAAFLVNGRNVRVTPLTGPVEYWHIDLGAHHVIFSEGAATESLYLGEVAQSAGMSEAAELFPDHVPQRIPRDDLCCARRVARAFEGRLLAESL